jgi:hypothetical protein
MSRSKEHRFQVAGKERENGWQNCGSACSWGGGAQWAKNQKNVQKLKFSSEFNKLNFI